MASKTRLAVSSLTFTLPLNTRETVMVPTPASLATSLMRGGRFCALIFSCAFPFNEVTLNLSRSRAGGQEIGGRNENRQELGGAVVCCRVRDQFRAKSDCFASDSFVGGRSGEPECDARGALSPESDRPDLWTFHSDWSAQFSQSCLALVRSDLRSDRQISSYLRPGLRLF